MLDLIHFILNDFPYIDHLCFASLNFIALPTGLSSEEQLSNTLGPGVWRASKAERVQSAAPAEDLGPGGGGMVS